MSEKLTDEQNTLLTEIAKEMIDGAAALKAFSGMCESVKEHGVLPVELCEEIVFQMVLLAGECNTLAAKVMKLDWMQARLSEKEKG